MRSKCRCQTSFPLGGVERVDVAAEGLHVDPAAHDQRGRGHLPVERDEVGDAPAPDPAQSVHGGRAQRRCGLRCVCPRRSRRATASRPRPPSPRCTRRAAPRAPPSGGGGSARVRGSRPANRTPRLVAFLREARQRPATPALIDLPCLCDHCAVRDDRFLAALERGMNLPLLVAAASFSSALAVFLVGITLIVDSSNGVSFPRSVDAPLLTHDIGRKSVPVSFDRQHGRDNAGRDAQARTRRAGASHHEPHQRRGPSGLPTDDPRRALAATRHTPSPNEGTGVCPSRARGHSDAPTTPSRPAPRRRTPTCTSRARRPCTARAARARRVPRSSGRGSRWSGSRGRRSR